jgi:hypothetical protein
MKKIKWTWPNGSFDWLPSATSIAFLVTWITLDPLL